MGKWRVYRCLCSLDCQRHPRWLAVSPDGLETTWASWGRAMLRATKGY